MENLNAEQVKKVLECCVKVGGYRDAQICNDCPLSETRCAILLPQNALALIKELTEKIGDLECKVEEYRADAISWQATVDEISNGDKALYDAINSLRRKSREYDELNLKAYNLNMEIKELTEENKKLTVNMNAYGLTAKRLTEENERLRAEKEAENKELFHKWKKIADETADRYEGLYQDAKKSLVASTVRKMQERLIAEFRKDDRMNYYLRMTLDQIAKEILEGEK